jgi:hypothetical protein
VSLDAAEHATIDVHVDGPDGTLEATFGLIDTLGLIQAPVRALGRGLVGTPSIGVVAAAGYRAASPHARFRLAQDGEAEPTARRRSCALPWRGDCRHQGSAGREWIRSPCAPPEPS